MCIHGTCWQYRQYGAMMTKRTYSEHDIHFPKHYSKICGNLRSCHTVSTMSQLCFFLAEWCEAGYIWYWSSLCVFVGKLSGPAQHIRLQKFIIFHLSAQGQKSALHSGCQNRFQTKAQQPTENMEKWHAPPNIAWYTKKTILFSGPLLNLQAFWKVIEFFGKLFSSHVMSQPKNPSSFVRYSSHSSFQQN